MKIITSGHTRLVILTRTRAIKIAKIRFGYPFERVRAILRNGAASEKIREWKRTRGVGPLKVVLKAMFSGFFANRAELIRCRKYPNAPLVPTLRTFAYVVNIQRLGAAIRDHEIRQHPIARVKVDDPGLLEDLVKPDNYFKIDGRVCLADYGHPALERVLARNSF